MPDHVTPNDVAYMSAGLQEADETQDERSEVKVRQGLHSHIVATYWGKCLLCWCCVLVRALAGAPLSLSKGSLANLHSSL